MHTQGEHLNVFTRLRITKERRSRNLLRTLIVMSLHGNLWLVKCDRNGSSSPSTCTCTRIYMYAQHNIHDTKWTQIPATNISMIIASFCLSCTFLTRCTYLLQWTHQLLQCLGPLLPFCFMSIKLLANKWHPFFLRCWPMEATWMNSRLIHSKKDRKHIYVYSWTCRWDSHKESILHVHSNSLGT